MNVSGEFGEGSVHVLLLTDILEFAWGLKLGPLEHKCNGVKSKTADTRKIGT
jgi:hypothetical protein